jgi:hypothetical protein
MRANLLHVVACISNPIRWNSRISLAKKFIQHMLDSGVKLTLVECAYGDRPFDLAGIEGVNHVGVRAKSVVWIKENLLNIGVSRLPPDWKYVAFIDADIIFRRPNWAAETVHALQQYDVVQPWSDCYDLGPNDDHLQAHHSFGKLVQQGEPIQFGKGNYKFGHPGFAWAFTRTALEWVGGLIDTAALGAADHHMAGALIGKAVNTFPGGINTSYARHIYQWQQRAQSHGITLSYVPGTIEHGWHGPKALRKYVDRWGILVKHDFNPDTDLKRNIWGVYELAGNKPELAHDIDLYMRGRDEDSNSLSV